ncbi:uncharacterized protein LOC116604725 [Nematostella vectensis]|uniref:uncharacterized protein LOC116604725 n=1 Tax=Nematostella vectensis TaxID=45351 RepID=UPI002077848F|nr:uncharacterized protein LOC116604725 [Nematostella vectensis]
MASPTTRKVLWLCLLILLQEFGPVHPAFLRRKTKSHKGDTPAVNTAPDMDTSDDKQDDGDEVEESKLKPQPVREGSSPKRGISWIPNVLKKVKVASEWTAKTVNFLGLGNNIYRAIAGCCVEAPEACTKRDEFLAMKTEMTEKSRLADELQLEVEQAQVWTGKSIEAFQNIVDRLEVIGDEQTIFLRRLTNNLTNMHEAENQVLKYIQSQKLASQKAEYLKVDEMYQTAIKTGTSLTTSLMGNLLPLATKLFEYAKAKHAALETLEAERKSGSSLKDPPKGTKKGNEVRLKRQNAIRRKTNIEKMTSIKSTTTQKWGKIVNFGERALTGITSAFTFASAGITLYFAIAQFQECQTKREQVLKSTAEMKNAVTEFDAAMTNLTEANVAVNETFQDFRSKITDENFLSGIQSMKDLVEQVSPAGNDELAGAVVNMQSFVDRIPVEKSYEETYNLLDMLLSSLQSVPATISCFTNKATMLEQVIRECKQGTKSFDSLYDEAVDIGEEGSKQINCNAKIGAQYVTREGLKEGLKEMAEKEGFSENCEANNPVKKELVCTKKNDGYEAGKIAEDTGLSLETVEFMLAGCPEVTQLTPAEVTRVCRLRKETKWADERISEVLGFPLDLVKATQCP